MDGIRSLDRLTRLAERTGVTLTIRLVPGEAREVGEVDLEVFQLGFTADGDMDQLNEFFRALQEGILPGLVINDVQIRINQEQSSLSATTSLLTLSGQPLGATPPSFLKAGAAPAPAPAVSRVDATDVPVMSFSVESLFSGTDALRSLRLQVSPPEALSTLKLYADRLRWGR